LHDTIHTQRDIQGPTYEDAMALYTNRGTRELQQSLEKLMEVLDRAILLRLIRGEFVREWKGRLGFLRKLLHV